MPAKPAPEEHLTAEQIDRLPIWAVVKDGENDTYTRVNNGPHTLVHDKHLSRWSGDEIVREYGPVTLVWTPESDPYQEARLALRDVLGMEPDEQMIRNTMDTARQPRTSVEQAATLTVGAAKLAGIGSEPAHEVAQSILIVTALGDDTGSRLVVSADTTAGLARLRAHSALDALLDQHGISR